MEQGKQQVLGALSAGDELFDSHKKWWKDYFEESGICIPDKFMEKQWYMTNYLFAQRPEKEASLCLFRECGPQMRERFLRGREITNKRSEYRIVLYPLSEGKPSGRRTMLFRFSLESF